jgi:hypothetical protein
VENASCQDSYFVGRRSSFALGLTLFFFACSGHPEQSTDQDVSAAAVIWSDVTVDAVTMYRNVMAQ